MDLHWKYVKDWFRLLVQMTTTTTALSLSIFKFVYDDKPNTTSTALT